MPHSNNKYRRMLSRLPDQMKMLMELCNREVVIIAYHAGSTGWSVDFRNEGTDFRLEYDRGFLVAVKDPDSEAKVIVPEKGTWSSESLSGLADAIMKDTHGNAPLRKNMMPSTIRSEVVSLEPILRLHANSDAVDRATLRYQNWHASLPSQTSLLNHRLYFLQLVEEESGNNSLKENEQIAEALLDGTGIRATGDILDWQGKRYTLAWRKISPMYGVEMCFQSDDGTVLHREVHD